MPLKPCTGCLALIEKTSLTSGRCPACQAEHERQRGTRRQRGIGIHHEALARRLKELPPENFQCSSCGVRGDEPGVQLTVGHIVPRVRCLAIGRDPDTPDNLTVECRSCNLSKGGSL